MPANDDFFVKFGSNASTFAKQLKTDLAPAKAEIVEMARMLATLEKKSGDPTLRSNLAALAGSTSVPASASGQGTSAPTIDTRAIEADFETMSRTLKGIVSTLSQTANAFVKQKNQQDGANARLGEGRGGYTNNGKLVSNADVAAGKYPNATRMVSAGAPDPVITKLLRDNLTRPSPAPTLAPVNMSALTKVQLDQSGFDRVVGAINELKAVIQTGVRTTGVAPGAPAAAVPQVSQGSASAPEDSEENLQKRADTLRKKIAEYEVGNQRIVALMNQAGLVTDDGMNKMLAESKEAQGKVKTQLAALDREISGAKKGDQKEARRAQAAANRGPDLPEAEYDRRKNVLQGINLAASPDAFRASIGRGAGKMGRPELSEIAKNLTDLGFEVKHNQKTNMKDLGDRIISARQAYGERYGAEIPESLRTGARIKDDVVGSRSQQLTAQLNMSAVQIEEENLARERIRLARLSGALPKDPTEELTQDRKIMGQSAIGGSPVGRNMVKGGSYTDAYSYEASERLLKERRIGRASVLANDPNFNPHSFSLKDDVKGHGPDAEQARAAVREIRRGATELDELGELYNAKLRAIQHMTDPKEINRLKAELASDKFMGLQDQFEDSDYRTGLNARENTRAEQRARQEEFDRQKAAIEPHNFTNVRGATEQAVIGTHLAPGGGKNYIKNIPGASYNPYLDGGQGGYAFDDDQKDPKRLTQLNQDSRSYQSSLQREKNLAEDQRKFKAGLGDEDVSEKLEKARAKTENKAVAFANQMSEVFQISPSVESLIGRPVSEANANSESRRIAQADAARALATAKVDKRTPEQELALREAAVTAASKALTDANNRLATARQKAAEQQKKDDAAAASLTAAQREQIATRKAAEQRVFQLGTRLSKLPMDPILQRPEGVEGPNLKNTGFFSKRGPTQELAKELAEAEAALAKLPPAINETVAKVRSGNLTERQAERLSDPEGIKTLQQNLANAKARRDETRAALKDVSSKAPGDKPAAATAAGADLATLSKQHGEAVALQSQVRALRKNIDDAKAMGVPYADRKPLYDERDAIKASPAYLQDQQIKALRKQMHAAGAGGVGGGDRVPPTGGRGGRGGGFESGANAILSDILKALNGIHRTIQTGVKTVGGPKAASTVKTVTDADGTVREVKRNYTPLKGATYEEVLNAKSDDPEKQALARSAQRRRLERMKAEDINGPGRAYDQAVEEDVRRSNKTVKRDAKNAEILRAEARALIAVTDATKLLDTAAKGELSSLRAMNAAGKESAAIALQQAKAFRAAEQAMATQGVPKAQRTQMIGTLLSDANVRPDGTKGPAIKGEELNAIKRSSAAVNGFRVVDEQMAAGVAEGGIFGEQSAFTQKMFGNSGFWSRVMGSTGAFVVRNFTAGFVFGITNALQEIITQAILTESTFIRVSDALEQTGRTTGSLRTDLQSISGDYGTQLNDIYEVAAGLTGMFESTEEIAGASRVVAQLQLISMGALNATEAMGVLVSIAGAYNEELPSGEAGLTKVADVLTVIQNNLGTNIEVISEGVGSLAGLSAQLNIDFEDTATYVAQIAKLTNQTGAASGEQFSRILATMQTGRGRAAIQKVLPDAGIDVQLANGDYGAALENLMKNWDGLSKSQQRQLAVSLAGQRQARAFAALFNNTTKTLNTAAEAHDAMGQAEERSKNIAATLNAEISKLGSNLQIVAQNLIRTGILDFLGLFLKTTNMVLSGFNTFVSTMNDWADKNPVVNAIKRIVFGLLGFIATMKIARMAYSGFRASLAAAAVQEGVVGAGLRGAGVGLTAEERRAKAPIVRPWLDKHAAQAQAGRASFMPMASSRPGQFDADGRPISAPPVFLGGNKVASSDPKAFDNDTLKKQSRLYSGAGRAAGLASRGIGGLTKGLGALQNAGLGAQLGMAALAAVIITVAKEIGDDRERANRYDQMRAADKKKKEDDAAGEGDNDAPYIGKYSKQADANLKDKKIDATPGGLYQAFLVSQVMQPIEDLKNPIDAIKERVGNFKDQGPLAFTAAGPLLNQALTGDESRMMETYRRRAGINDPETMDKLLEFQNLAKGKLDEVETTQPRLIERTPGAQSSFPGVKKFKPGMTKENILAAQKEFDADYAAEEKRIDLSDTSKQQKTAQMAYLEKVALATNDRIAAMILRAEGIAALDNLSMQQMGQVDELRGLYQSTSTSGTDVNAANPKYSAAFGALLGDTGISPESKQGKILAQLQQGNLTKSQASELDTESLDLEIANLSAKYETATNSEETTVSDEDIEKMRASLLAKLGERAQKTAEVLAAFIDESNVLAEAAVSRGAYGDAAIALNTGLNLFESRRNRKAEDPVTRARNDQTEVQGAERVASLEAEGKNVRLNEAKARSRSSTRDGRLDEQVARNAYDALIKQQMVARQSGREGPSIKAIAEAKNQWIEAQNANADAAESANIAAMTAAVAGMWNEAAIGAGNERIAMQALEDAKAKGDAAAISAAEGNLAGVRKTNQSRREAEAQAARETAIARIPEGNTEQLRRAQVASVRKQLKAAEKLGKSSVTYQGLLQQLYGLQKQADDALEGVAEAQASLAMAYADARGDTVGSARIAVDLARIALGKAQATGSQADVINAQADLVAKQDAYGQAQVSLVQSQMQVGIAMADARGDAVSSAGRALAAGRAALRAALARSGGMNTEEVNSARATLIGLNASYAQAQVDLIQAQISVGVALADARGNTVGSARRSYEGARAVLRAALARSGGENTAEVLSARAGLIGAHAAMNAAIVEHAASRAAIGIAIADAAGRTVRSAQLQLQAARVALRAARRKSGGRNTTEVNQARASEISARAAVRDAALQDRLDTIDFNLSMNKITQSGAIAALQQILKTANLTKQQRRDLLLKIKGMKDEIANDSWNFGDIRMPKPYEMRRYIENQRAKRERAAGMDTQLGVRPNTAAGGNTTTNTTTIAINGADVAKVRKIIEEVVGGSMRTRTTQARRR